MNFVILRKFEEKKTFQKNKFIKKKKEFEYIRKKRIIVMLGIQ